MIPPVELRWLAEQAGGSELEALIRRRRAGEPLQYVLGEWAFRTLALEVDRRALIPRPETEQVVEAALRALAARDPGARSAPGVGGGPVVVDLGTGTGAIALAIATELTGASVWATDVDPAALALAGSNARRVGAAVTLLEGSWYDPLPPELRGRVDLVVSNPPYVSEAEWPGLDPEVREEPYGALVAAAGSDGTPGLAAVEAVLRGSIRWLSPGGVVAVEVAPHQARAAVAVAEEAGLRAVRVEKDLAGRERTVLAGA